MTSMHLHRALVPKGLERVAAKEIRNLGGGIGKTRPDRASVLFEGPADAFLRANLHLRTVDRVLLRVGTAEARFENELLEALLAVPFERWIRPGSRVQVAVSTRGCRLFHTGMIENIARRALSGRGVGDGLPAEESTEAQGRTTTVEAAPDEPAASIDLRGTEDRWEFAVDTSGRSLNRRGYRRAVAKAPLRETIAAGILSAAGFIGDRDLLDPMCGAGTIVTEAAWIAAHRAPGLTRRFAFEQFPSLDRARWTALVERARSQLDWTRLPALEGSDKAKGALRAARSNSGRAELDRRTRWVQRPLVDLPRTSPDSPPGLVIFNPPYGKRGQAEGAPRGSSAELDAWRRWGELIRERRPGWAAWVLAPHPQLAAAAGARGRARLSLVHGGISVELHRIA
jgi:putative N6-adenine-specific DNA methylase